MSHYQASLYGSDGVGHGKRKVNTWRKGKTIRDHNSGAHRRNQENKFTRASWQNDGSKRDPFNKACAHTCNGKRNRFSGASAI